MLFKDKRRISLDALSSWWQRIVSGTTTTNELRAFLKEAEKWETNITWLEISKDRIRDVIQG